MIGRKPLHLDVEHVRSRRQGWETQLTLLVGGQRRATADQRRGTDTDDCTGDAAALCVLDSSNKGPGHTLRGSYPWQQDTPGGEKEHHRSAHAQTPLRRGFYFTPLPAEKGLLTGY